MTRISNYTCESYLDLFSKYCFRERFRSLSFKVGNSAKHYLCYVLTEASKLSKAGLHLSGGGMRISGLKHIQMHYIRCCLNKHALRVKPFVKNDSSQK